MEKTAGVRWGLGGRTHDTMVSTLRPSVCRDIQTDPEIGITIMYEVFGAVYFLKVHFIGSYPYCSLGILLALKRHYSH